MARIDANIFTQEYKAGHEPQMKTRKNQGRARR
jgi:hypothetical protein